MLILVLVLDLVICDFEDEGKDENGNPASTFVLHTLPNRGDSRPVAAVAATSDQLLGSLLKQVSRSFHLTLRVLPRAVRPQIGLAYLLARATDTIADTNLLPVSERLDALARLRARILGQSTASLGFGEFAGQQASPAERSLLGHVEESLALLDLFEDEDRQRIRDVLSIITSGQELDLRRFDGASVRLIHALHGDIDLDDYTYRVAGCVGEFWTKMCLAHLFAEAGMATEDFLAAGVRFGKGLQLVNILRDLPRDLRNGRCYIPSQLLDPAGLTPADLLKPESEPRFRPIYDPLLDRALEHLTAGWIYTNALPQDQKRLRLACAWPALIGVRTLELLRAANPLDPALHVKVTRGEVYRLMFRSVCCLPFPDRWRGQFVPPGLFP